MKLLLITCIEEFEKDVKKILNHSEVKSFSVQSVKGYKNEPESELPNWFGSEYPATDSLLFIVFSEEKCLDNIMSGIEAFNTQRSFLSRIHLASFNIEKSI